MRRWLLSLLMLCVAVNAHAALTFHMTMQADAANTNVPAAVGGTDGVLTNNGNTEDASVPGPGGLYPNAIHFDGVDGYIVVGSNAIPGTSTAIKTVCFWIRFDDTVTSAYVLHRSSASSLVRMGATASDVSFSSQTDNITATIPDETWVHVALVGSTGDVLTMYLNNVAQADVESNTGALAATQYIGRSSAGGYTAFAIADLRIYDTNEAANLPAIMAEASSQSQAPRSTNQFRQRLTQYRIDNPFPFAIAP